MNSHFRKRVFIRHKNGGLSVRIERQNAYGVYVHGCALSTVMFVGFARMVWEAIVSHPQVAVYTALLLLPGIVLYLLVLAYCAWGAIGVEQVSVENGFLYWTLTVWKWSRTRTIPVGEIDGVKTITPWYGDNTVEIATVHKVRKLGDKILYDEAVELADKLRHAIGLGQAPRLPT